MMTVGNQRIERIFVLLDTKSIATGPVYLGLAIQQFVKTILQACTKDGLVLWSFKIFDSSISPFSFRTRVEKLLGKWATDVRFDSAEDAACNFAKFSDVLKLIHGLKGEKASAPNADFVVRAIQEVLEDYTWDPLMVNDGSSSDYLKRSENNFSVKVHSNIVLLFSSFPKVRKEMNEFFNKSDEPLRKNIASNFQSLQTRFQRKNIRPFWIDTDTTLKCYYDLALQRVVCTALEKIGWGIASVDSLLLELVCPLPEEGFGNSLPTKRMRAFQHCWLQQEKKKLKSILEGHSNALKMVIWQALKLKENKNVASSLKSEKVQVICQALKLKENKNVASSLKSEKVQEGAIPEEQPECKVYAMPDITISKAHDYIELLAEKLNGCLNLIELDIQTFAARVVKDTLHANQILVKHANENAGNKSEGCNGTSNFALNRLRDLLLKSPKILAQKHKNCTHGADQNGAIKVKEYELQIKLRFEIILALRHGQLNQVENKHSDEICTQLTNEICMLLDRIQFILPGGIFEGESLLDFSNRVIRPRYCDSLPEVIENIYSVMELNGFPDLEADAVVTFKEIHLSSQACRPNGMCEKDMSSPEKRLKEAKEKRERARRFSHFQSGAQNLLRQRVVRKQMPRSKRKKHPEAKDLASCSDVHFVPETPVH